MVFRKYDVAGIFAKANESKAEIRILKSTPFIVSSIFFERFCSAGIVAILPLFLHIKLGLNQNDATSIFHIFEGGSFLFAIIGIIIAETWTGIYNAVVYNSIVFVIGLGIIAVTMVESINLPVGLLVSIGLIIIVIGSGSLKNNLNAFGGGQHKLPEQKKQLQTYFSLQYFFLKFGGFCTRICTPLIRSYVKCFGKNECYSFVFAFPSTLMFISFLVLISGNRHYTEIKPNGNMLVKIIKCSKNAISEKLKNPQEVKEHWLDYAEGKFGKKFIAEAKIALKIIALSLPIPLFWSCLMQQSSRWVFQGTKLNLDLGFYDVKPDQMIVINSMVVLLLLPVLDKYIYPFLKKCGIRTMLQRLIFGGYLVVAAFTLALILETQIQRNFISILWQFPQFVTLGCAEMFIYISHMNFAYEQSPASMKPVMLSLIYISVGAGSIFVAIISGSGIFPSQFYEFLFFISIAVIAIIIMTFLARNYKHVDHVALQALQDNEANERDRF